MWTERSTPGGHSTRPGTLLRREDYLDSAIQVREGPLLVIRLGKDSVSGMHCLLCSTPMASGCRTQPTMNVPQSTSPALDHPSKHSLSPLSFPLYIAPSFLSRSRLSLPFVIPHPFLCHTHFSSISFSPRPSLSLITPPPPPEAAVIHLTLFSRCLGRLADRPAPYY